jgi:hypothetical protein
LLPLRSSTIRQLPDGANDIDPNVPDTPDNGCDVVPVCEVVAHVSVAPPVTNHAACVAGEPDVTSSHTSAAEGNVPDTV